MKYMVPSEIYQVLKWVGLIALPGLAAFTSTVGQAWGFDAGTLNAIVATINALGFLIGTLLGVSQATSKPEEGGADE